MRDFVLPLLLVSLSVACGGATGSPGVPEDSPTAGDDTQEADPKPAPSKTSGSGTKTQTPAPKAPEPTGPVPKLLVRGFGAGSDLLVGKARHFSDFTQFMVNDGLDAKYVHDLGDYNDAGTTKEMVDDVAAKMDAIMRTYPEGTRFDVMGHSLGGIVALRTVLDKNLAARVRTFVALSAPIYGQDQKPFNCVIGFRCSDIYEAYHPFQSPMVMEYMKSHAAALGGMKLCSLISPDDGTIVAPMAGAQFPGGTNVTVAKVTHMNIIHDKAAYEALRDQCLGGKP